MPIYAYRCGACGHAKDVLQKLSDPLLTTCPACGAEAFTKQVTAAGFQLKGSGWYVTDFRGGNSAGAAKEGESNPAEGAGMATPAAPADAAAPAAVAGPASAATPASGAAPAPAATSASASGSGGGKSA